MTPPAVPRIECEQYHATLPVNDLRAAVDYDVSKLGFTRGFTWGEPAHRSNPPAHRRAEARARHRLRRPRELPLRRATEAMSR